VYDLISIFPTRSKSRYSEKWTNRFPSPSGITHIPRLQDWRSLYLIVLLTCIAFLVRCVFRVAEFAGGYDSYLASHEGYFYLLDALPLALAVVLFAAVWPPEVFENGPWTGESGLGLEMRRSPGEESKREGVVGVHAVTYTGA
jgi:hypothetical protein